MHQEFNTTPIPLECEDCHEIKPDVALQDCPYDSDLHGIKTPAVICDNCAQERADNL